MTYSGRAYLVTHPRRKDQDFVSISPKVVASKVQTCCEINWKVNVSLVLCRGETADEVLAIGHESFDELLALLPEFVKRSPYFTMGLKDVPHA